MTGKNSTPLVGWHPPAGLTSRLRAEVEERGGGRGVQSAILTEALREWLDRNQDTGTSGKDQS